MWNLPPRRCPPVRRYVSSGTVDARQALDFGARHKRSASDPDELELAALDELIERRPTNSEALARLVDAVCHLARGRELLVENCLILVCHCHLTVQGGLLSITLAHARR